MAKNKKAASKSSSVGKKKTISTTSKKPVQRVINNKKVAIISDKLKVINRNFENLIFECQAALKEFCAI